ncbi:PQQ-dependent sugar dehydrogenase [Moheibacter sediminis]|uniref:Por secretion system C-terminal sorting domain-containing protein n=1 Tax=Moheibacter sediminis TaxID=1434700 RepID=A0A1W2BW06_9FLAO|nr:PQQ-dependent sugar dehydrogenase [Moheibacter sediminis]SMC77150.1 Por secretion system C-terminal sorting domain-containing protein [Moheibacter sediminis]
MKKIYFSIAVAILSLTATAQEFELQQFATGFTSPIGITNAGDDRLFVVQQGGQIRIINADGTINQTPFLNISSIISSGGERGLLGLAFDPDYASNGRFFVNYTNPSGDTVIARYEVSDNPDVAETTGTVILTIDQPFANHNGGDIHFGPDGYLWISMGDGGSGGDPQQHGQNINSLLGKMLRIDVSGTTYTSPADNPFVGAEGSDEIWSYGLRNAWRFSFDRETGDVWIADVGQNAIEEINHEPSNTAGLNYGWRCYEGNNTYDTSGCAAQETMTFPVATYNHSGGRCSITGGYVYRGVSYPNLTGKYFFADYCSGEIGWVDGDHNLEFLTDTNYFIPAFGESANGELYVAGNSAIYKIVGEEMSVNDLDKTNISVYPNPVMNQLNIQSNKPVNEVSIYNIEGKLLTSFTLNTDKIDFSNYAKGVYLVTVTTGKVTKTQKVIKN